MPEKASRSGEDHRCEVCSGPMEDHGPLDAARCQRALELSRKRESASQHSPGEASGSDKPQQGASERPNASPAKPWDWNGRCARCDSNLPWDGESPSSPEDAICYACLRTELGELRKARPSKADVALEQIRVHASGECRHTLDQSVECFKAIERLAEAALFARPAGGSDDR